MQLWYLVRYSDDHAATLIMTSQEQNQQCHQILLMSRLLPKDLNSRDTFSWLSFYDCEYMFTYKCNPLSEDGRGPDNWSLVEFVATHPLCCFSADISWDIYEPTLTSVKSGTGRNLLTAVSENWACHQKFPCFSGDIEKKKSTKKLSLKTLFVVLTTLAIKNPSVLGGLAERRWFVFDKQLLLFPLSAVLFTHGGICFTC